jgi:4-carboxymuconolactone decarboxylase
MQSDDEDKQIAARMQDVLGYPPRLLPLATEDLTPHQFDAIEQVRLTIGGWPADAPHSPALLTLCRHAEIYLPILATGLSFVSSGALLPRDRELAIMRTAWLSGAPFVFGEHVELGKRIGVTAEEVEWMKEGAAAVGWPSRDRAILCAVEDLSAAAMISDATWAQLVEHLDERQLIELPLLVGHYRQVAYVQNSLRLRVNDYNRGLFAT